MPLQHSAPAELKGVEEGPWGMRRLPRADLQQEVAHPGLEAQACGLSVAKPVCLRPTGPLGLLRVSEVRAGPGGVPLLPNMLLPLPQTGKRSLFSLRHPPAASPAEPAGRAELRKGPGRVGGDVRRQAYGMCSPRNLHMCPLKSCLAVHAQPCLGAPSLWVHLEECLA